MISKPLTYIQIGNHRYINILLRSLLCARQTNKLPLQLKGNEAVDKEAGDTYQDTYDGSRSIELKVKQLAQEHCAAYGEQKQYARSAKKVYKRRVMRPLAVRINSRAGERVVKKCCSHKPYSYCNRVAQVHKVHEQVDDRNIKEKAHCTQCLVPAKTHKTLFVPAKLLYLHVPLSVHQRIDFKNKICMMAGRSDTTKGAGLG
jgi:hypothetical protein